MKLEKLQEILFTTLDIIGYKEDKKAFVADFIQICLQHIVANLMQSLSPEQQQSLEKAQGNLKILNLEEKINHINNVMGVSKKDIQQLAMKINKGLFDEYIKTIIPTLNPTQKSELEVFLETI